MLILPWSIRNKCSISLSRRLSSFWLLLSRSSSFGQLLPPAVALQSRVALLTSPSNLCFLQCIQMCCGHPGCAKLADQGQHRQRPLGGIIVILRCKHTAFTQNLHAKVAQSQCLSFRTKLPFDATFSLQTSHTGRSGPPYESMLS